MNAYFSLYILNHIVCTVQLQWELHFIHSGSIRRAVVSLLSLGFGIQPRRGVKKNNPVWNKLLTPSMLTSYFLSLVDFHLKWLQGVFQASVLEGIWTLHYNPKSCFVFHYSSQWCEIISFRKRLIAAWYNIRHPPEIYIYLNIMS